METRNGIWPTKISGQIQDNATAYGLDDWVWTYDMKLDVVTYHVVWVLTDDTERKQGETDSQDHHEDHELTHGTEPVEVHQLKSGQIKHLLSYYYTFPWVILNYDIRICI